MSIDINLLILITAMIFIIKACIYILTAVRLTSSQICCFMLTAAALALDYKCKRPHKPRRQRRVLGGALRCVWHLLQHDGGHRRRQPQRLPAVQVPTARCNPGPLQSGRLFLSLRPLTNPHFSCLYAFADVDLWLYGRPTAIARPLHSASLLLALSSRLRCSAVTPPALHPAAAQSPSSTTRAGSRPR